MGQNELKCGGWESILIGQCTDHCFPQWLKSREIYSNAKENLGGRIFFLILAHCARTGGVIVMGALRMGHLQVGHIKED